MKKKKKLEATIRDIEQNIKKLVWPEWKVVARIILPEDVEKVKVNILDASKVFPKDQDDIIKTIEFGRLRLNRLPRNQFAEVEQAAFCAANIVPGWDITPDPIFQCRIFAYPDTQRHRLGVNSGHLPVNRPKRVWNPLRRDGPNSLFNYEDIPTYVADYHQIQALEGTRTNSSSANPDRWGHSNKLPTAPKVPHWDTSAAGDAAINVTRGLNEWAEQDPLEQPRNYYFNDLAGPPPEKHCGPQYVRKAAEKGIDYRQWALIENYAQHLHGARWDIRVRTYEMFFEMDTVNREGKWPTEKSLGNLIRERTVELINASKHAEDSDDEDEEGLPRYASIPSLEVSRALAAPTNPYLEVSQRVSQSLPDNNVNFLPN